ncbi:MAG: hypothetical protein JEZ12_21060 [Desulfobacterium sp.]|nr:hypothetical protein [Desulfobacterium sp.]
MIYLLVILFLIGAAEISARLLYSKKHGLKFIPKRIGEYPYNRFVEECGPPLYWRLKPGQGEQEVHINSLGLRSPERRQGCRHLWVVGESDLFGAKLIHEEKIWFKALQGHLDRAGYDIQVMNASVIGYNSHQAMAAVTQLPIEKDDLILLRPNVNDISIAYMHGSDWEPATPWPMAFIHKLERHKPWVFKLADMSCLGMGLRRRFFKESNITSAFTPKPGFQLEPVVAHQKECLGQMIEFARSKGATVGFFDLGFSYEPEIRPGDRAKLSSIQGNWESLVSGWAHYQFQSMDAIVKQLAEPAGLPVLKVSSHIWQHPDRYHLFLDLVHFNEHGHAVFAQALYDELVASRLLNKGN